MAKKHRSCVEDWRNIIRYFLTIQSLTIKPTVALGIYMSGTTHNQHQTTFFLANEVPYGHAFSFLSHTELA